MSTINISYTANIFLLFLFSNIIISYLSLLPLSFYYLEYFALFKNTCEKFGEIQLKLAMIQFTAHKFSYGKHSQKTRENGPISRF